MSGQNTPVDLFDFELPPERIAQAPANERDQSRLLVLEGDAAPQHRTFSDFPTFLRSGDLLVRNATKVIPARLMGRRSGGGKTEILLVREIGPCLWECLARPTSHLKPGKPVTFGDGELVAFVEERRGAGRILARFELRDGDDFWGLVERFGATPLPPYIGREGGGPTQDDRERYQTVYARERGAVAAPTAGLHFTPKIFSQLEEKGVEVAELILHVGPGTFRPVKSDTVEGHVMDTEWFDIPGRTAESVNRALAEKRRVIAIGTTSTRALEAAGQGGTVTAGPGETDIFITPPYKFNIISGLVTNFHLPRSTLLMLVCALGGRERMLAAYREAVEREYRFYSYGDAMLIIP